MPIHELLFWSLAALAVASALAAVGFVGHPIASVLGMGLALLACAGVFVLLEAHFVALALVMVAAAMSLALLLSTLALEPYPPARFGRLAFAQRAVKLAALGAALWLGQMWLRELSRRLAEAGSLPPGYGEVGSLGFALFGDYLLVTELVGPLLLAAALGSVVLAYRGSR